MQLSIFECRNDRNINQGGAFRTVAQTGAVCDYRVNLGGESMIVRSIQSPTVQRLHKIAYVLVFMMQVIGARGSDSRIRTVHQALVQYTCQAI